MVKRIVFKNRHFFASILSFANLLVSRKSSEQNVDTSFESLIHTFILGSNACRVFLSFDRKQEVRLTQGVNIREIKYRESDRGERNFNYYPRCIETCFISKNEK